MLVVSKFQGKMEFFYHFDKLKKLTITHAGMRFERYTLVFFFVFVHIFDTKGIQNGFTDRWRGRSKNTVKTLLPLPISEPSLNAFFVTSGHIWLLPYKTLKIMKLVQLFQEAGELTHLIPPGWIFSFLQQQFFK